MKPVKILKRPTQPPRARSPLDRTTAELTALLDTALQRERTRLEAVYRARQDALLRALSAVLNDSLERVVAAAARRETDALLHAFAKLARDFPRPDHDPAAARRARDAFARAFEAAALPHFERATAAMLRAVAAGVEAQVDDRLLQPSAAVVAALEGAADSIRAVNAAVADMAAADSDAADVAAVQSALDDGNVREALMLCVGKSVAVRAKAVSGVLDLSVGPEEAFGGVVPPLSVLVKLAAVLSMELADRTEARLTWLYEVVALMDDADEYDPGDPDVVEGSKRRLEGTIERLTDFQRTGNPGPTELKHTKLLIRVLRAHLNAM